MEMGFSGRPSEIRKRALPEFKGHSPRRTFAAKTAGRNGTPEGKTRLCPVALWL